MSSYPCQPSRTLLGAALAGAALQVHASIWFGEACTVASVGEPVAAAVPHVQLMAVRLSPIDTGDITSVLVTADGQYWVSREKFYQWQLPLPQGTPQQFDASSWYALREISGLQFRFDPCSQELWIDVSDVRGLRNRYNIATEQKAPVSALPEPGGHFNLDALYLQARRQQQFSGTGELGFFSQQGYGTHSFLYVDQRHTRLETQWSHDWPERTERLSVGDGVTRGGLIGQASRFGGVQWGTEFALQPDLVTFPLPSLRGQAALPSSVDVYVNQVLRAQQQVPAGSFELRDVPVVTGSGNVQLVVRDVLGRSQVVNYPFYATPTLLREGLSEYSAQGGFLRQDFGFVSNRYRQGFVSGRYRRGLSPKTTGELYAESSTGQQMLGAGMAGVALPYGNWNLGLAAAHVPHGVGAYGTAGLEHVGTVWNAAVQVQAATPSFGQLGQRVGALRRQMLIRVGVVPHVEGMANLTFVQEQRRDLGSNSILSLNYGLRVSRDWFLNAGLAQIFGRGDEVTVTVGITHPLGARKTFSGQQSLGPGASTSHLLSLQKDPLSDLGLGYRVSTDQGSLHRTTAGARYGGERGSVTAEGEHQERGGSSNSLRLGVSSALAVLGRDLFWTRPVSSSFAVVDAGAPGVQIYNDNQLVGVSRTNGLLLVPGLRAYQQNLLRIEDNDLPLRYAAQSLSLAVVPPAQSGLRVRFLVSGATTLNVILQRRGGAAVPTGASLQLDGVALDLPVGFAGQVFAEVPPGLHRLHARWPGGECDTMVVVALDAGADQPAMTAECQE